MNKINRRDFLKHGTLLGVGAAALGALTGCNSAASSAAASSVAGIYTPGTYTATANGMNGPVTATVTFDEVSITEVVLDVSGETESIGQAAKDKLVEQIMTAQTSQIDGVTGATVTSKAVQNAVADCISQASGGAIQPAPQDTSSSSAGSDWLGQEPEIAESEITETRECEVLVVGAGSSGTFAAASAVEMGAKTILIEKFGHDMASGIRDTLAACGSTEQKQDGDDVDPAEAVRYLCDWSHGYTKRSLAQVWADKSGETIDWFAARLAEGGMEFRHEIDDATLPSNYKVLDVGHSTQYGPEYTEQLTMDIVLDYAQNLGLEVQYEITMVKLEKDGDRVCGLIAKDAEGNYIRYKASKGVILACGGYSGNEEMMLALQPQSVEQTCVNYSKPGAKGDGIKACLWAGAIMDTTHTSMIFDRGAVKPDEHGEYGKASNGQLFWMGSQPFLKVNLKGERFMNEYQPYDMVLHSASSQPYHTYCTIWDSNYTADCEKFETHGCSRLFNHKNGTAPVFPMEMVVGMNEELEANGYIVKADTIEELAEKLGLPVETFAATVARYNELAAKGVDEDFGKEGYRLSALAAAPYYGVRQSGGYLICTMDGIQIDENMHALNADYEPIAGLYVIGDMSGNYFSQSYPCLLAGAAAGRSATFGRLAGQNAAQGI
ncbi:FAD-binding protein [Faecalibacterium gallinarum]|uniref:Urocanate reductase n=1 Tax=Faecalibacterium gallinarum TaxID=2903556 RepID=A0AA37MZA9_9FIRM|nr:FAD-binding protein [Faecalibacterium gallinarum]GJN65357.1 FAD-binding dehydrogenase [Faecalibacterium gallinarum]